jgi:hypothetical protein
METFLHVNHQEHKLLTLADQAEADSLSLKRSDIIFFNLNFNVSLFIHGCIDRQKHIKDHNNLKLNFHLIK